MKTGLKLIEQLRDKAKLIKIDIQRVNATLRMIDATSQAAYEALQLALANAQDPTEDSSLQYKVARTMDKHKARHDERWVSLDKVKFGLVMQQKAYGNAIQQLISLHHQPVTPPDWYIIREEMGILRNLLTQLTTDHYYDMRFYEYPEIY